MLVLSRKRNESIVIADQIVITVVEVRGDKVRLGIRAPRDMRIDREEVYQKLVDLGVIELEVQTSEGESCKSDAGNC